MQGSAVEAIVTHIRAAAVFARPTVIQAAGLDLDPVAAVCCGMYSGPDSLDDGDGLPLLRDKGKSIFYTIHEDAVHAARLFHAVQGMRANGRPSAPFGKGGKWLAKTAVV